MMSIETIWEDFTSSEKHLFQKSCRRLLKQTFLVRDKDEDYKKMYYFVAKRQSVSINRQDVSTSINTQLDSLIPASKIANLSQGTFVGAVSDNFGEKIEQKIFHAEIIVDHEKVSGEEKNYKKIPVINEFRDREGNDIMTQQIGRNYDRIKADAQAIINMEMERIKNDPELCRRLGLENEDDKKKRNGKQE